MFVGKSMGDRQMVVVNLTVAAAESSNVALVGAFAAGAALAVQLCSGGHRPAADTVTASVECKAASGKLQP